jgi:hypothetical protein
LFLAPCVIQASINAFIFDGLFAAPAGIVIASFPVSHKYTTLFAGVVVLRKLPFTKAVYAVASDKFGAIVPLWQPLNAQLFPNMGCMPFEKLTVVVIAGELSIGTVVVLVQLLIINTSCITTISPIIVFFFDMILILSDKKNRSIYFWKCKVKPGSIA